LQYIGEIGTVHRVTDKGDIRVQYDGCTHRWTFHPGSLTKVNTFAVGDIVCVRSDQAHIKEHQQGHGEWIDVMKDVSNYLFVTYIICVLKIKQLSVCK
jgi:E3 ubiquitin-protein ligase mind-bomb